LVVRILDKRNEDKEFKDRTKVEAIICIAMPCRGRIPRSVFWAYQNLIKPKHYFVSMEHVPIDVARNETVKEFLVNMPDATHLLFWDADILPPRDGLVKLFQSKKAVVSGLYFHKYPPHNPHIYILAEGGKGFIPAISYPKNQLIEVEGCGAGFLLIRKDVLQHQVFMDREKWFSFDRGFGEDFDFSLSVNQTKEYKIYIDTSVICKHIADEYYIDDKLFDLYLEREQLKNWIF